MKVVILLLCLEYLTTTSGHRNHQKIGIPGTIVRKDESVGTTERTELINEVSSTGPAETETETPEASSTASIFPKKIMTNEEIRESVYEFTNLTSSKFNTAELLKRLHKIDNFIRSRTTLVNQEFLKEQNEMAELMSLLLQVRNIKKKLTEFDEHLSSLTDGIENFGKRNMTSSTLAQYSTAWVTLYKGLHQTRNITILDFRTCMIDDDCCKNLAELDGQTNSINTHDTCVKMFTGSNCSGESRTYQPNIGHVHYDFGSHRNTYSSGMPCKKSKK